MKPSKFFQFILFFVAIWMILNLFSGNNQKDNLPNQKTDIVLTPVKSKITLGQVVELKITNNKSINLKPWADCPHEPLDVYQWQNGEWIPKKVTLPETYQCNSERIVEPNETKILSYTDWNHDLFIELGKYKIVYREGTKEFPVEFEIVSPSFFGQLWDSLFYKPIYNTLIFFASVLPGHNLGWAIVVLTILIKILLIVPNHKALKAQKALQKIQPELDHIKEKHKGDQQKIAQETMAIWKKHKVNPLGSCLPMLIQFPIMIALFYVVQEGLSSNNIYLLYPFLKNFDLTLINPVFIGIIDLTQVNAFVLPLIVGGLQFVQMKLSFGVKKTENKKKGVQANQMQMMNKMMTYTLPVMIAFFTATMPAAVGIYWGVSTLFGIAQQLYINKKHH